MSCEASVCGRCELLPELPSGMQRVFVWPPIGHSAGKLTRLLSLRNIKADRARHGLIDFTIDAAALPNLLEAVAQGCSVEEMRGTRWLNIPAGREPGFDDYPQVTSLWRIRSLFRSNPLLDAMRTDDLQVSYAPIAYADAHDEIFAHRAAVTFPSLGMQAEQATDLAIESDILFQLDRMCRVSAIERMKSQRLPGPLFIDFQPASIYDPEFCLRSTVEAARKAALDSSEVVFSLSAPHQMLDLPHLQNILAFYRRQGFRVALGELGSGLGSLDLVQYLKPELVCLPAGLVHDVHKDPYRSVIARKLLEIAHRLQMETVALGARCGNDREWLYEHGAHYIELPLAAGV